LIYSMVVTLVSITVWVPTALAQQMTQEEIDAACNGAPMPSDEEERRVVERYVTACRTDPCSLPRSTGRPEFDAYVADLTTRASCGATPSPTPSSPGSTAAPLQTVSAAPVSGLSFDLTRYCDNSSERATSTDTAGELRYVRRFRCRNGQTVTPGETLGENPGLFQIIARQLHNEYAAYNTRYYLGSELNTHSGVVTPSRVPVCNLARQEGVGYHFTACNPDSIRDNITNDYTSLPGSDQNAPFSARITNNYDAEDQRDCAVRPNWIYNLTNGSPIAKDYWYCGAPCRFQEGQFTFADGSVRDSYIPRIPGLEEVRRGECQLEFAWYRGIWPHYLWNRINQLAVEIQRTGIISLTNDGTGRSPCGAVVDELNTTSVELDRLDSIVASTLSGRDVGSIQCERGSRQLVVADGGNVETLGDSKAKIAEGAGLELGRAQGENMSNSAICLLEAARIQQVKSITKLAVCEATWRAQIDYNTYVNDSEAMSHAISVIKDRMTNNYSVCPNCSVVDTSGCRSGDIEKRRQCYTNEIQKWFMEFFYNRIGTHIPMEPRGQGAPVDFDCIFNPGRAACRPGAATPVGRPLSAPTEADTQQRREQQKMLVTPR
jgi:hypothetical protein